MKTTAPRIIRLRNRWVPMDPREWNTQMDVSISVGLGTGNKDQMLAHLRSLLDIQVQAIRMQGGVDGPLVRLENVYNTLAKLVENAGLKSADPYFTDPAQRPPAPPPPPAPPQPDPTMVALQQQARLEAARLAFDRQRAAADLALDRARIAADIALKRDALALKARQAGLA